MFEAVFAWFNNYQYHPSTHCIVSRPYTYHPRLHPDSLSLSLGHKGNNLITRHSPRQSTNIPTLAGIPTGDPIQCRQREVKLRRSTGGTSIHNHKRTGTSAPFRYTRTCFPQYRSRPPGALSRLLSMAIMLLLPYCPRVL